MILAQTSQPTIPIPGIDASWLSWPGVRTVLSVAIVAAAILILFTKVIAPLFVSALKATGTIKRTAKEELLATVQANTEAIVDIADKMNDSTAVKSPDPAKIEPLRAVATGDPLPHFDLDKAFKDASE
jgi:hypothetical protein